MASVTFEHVTKRYADGFEAVKDMNLAIVTADLEREGVESFCDSYDQLPDCLEKKRGVATAIIGPSC